VTVGALVNGGQTGVDRGAARAAARLKLPIKGWRPAVTQEQCEDGDLPAMLARALRPLEFGGYQKRTVANVADSDALLVITNNRLRLNGGTKLTVDIAKGRAGMQIFVEDPTAGTGALIVVDAWLRNITALYDRPINLMVAGPRKSKWPEGERVTEEFLLELLGPQEKLKL
jgi:hypothetical protein